MSSPVLAARVAGDFGTDVSVSALREPRVAHLTGATTLGGAELCVLDLLATGVGSDLIAGGPGALAEGARALGARVRWVEAPRRLRELGESGSVGGLRLAAGLAMAAPGGLRHARRLRRALEEAFEGWAGPRLVRTSDLKSHAMAAAGGVCDPSRTGLIWHLHDYLSSRPAMSRLARWAADRWLGRGGRLAVAGVSESVASDARRALGAPRRGLLVVSIPNGIDLDRFRPPGPRERAEGIRALDGDGSGDGFEGVRVGLVATYARWKGHEVFLEAAGLLRGSGRDGGRGRSRYYVVGGPLYATRGSQWSEGELRDMGSRAGLSTGSDLVLTGHAARVERAYAGLDVVVHASTRPEPFGRVLAEGMACGRALATTGVGGAGEVVEAGVTALTAEAGSAASMASALERLIGDAGLRASMGAAGRSRAEALFDRRRLPGAWEAVHRWFLEPEPGGG